VIEVAPRVARGEPAAERASDEARVPFRAKLGARARAVSWLFARALLVALAAGLAAHAAFHRRLIDETRFTIPGDAFSVVDHTGATLRRQRGAGRAGELVDRRWVSLDRVDRDVVDAVIAVEDQRFREHAGVDLLATARALGQDLVPGGRRSGASTITQQLVKLVYGRERGWLSGAASKGLEILRAIELEERMSKDEILEQYLNRLPYGNGVEGIERAAEAYFGRGADELSLGEAALLAGLPQAPSRLDPRRHLERAIRRRDHVLGRMLALGLRTPEEIRLARAERPAIRRESPRSYRAPRFADQVVARVRRGELVPDAGAVETSLDLALQGEAEEILAASVARFDGRGASNGAAVVVVHATGEIRAYVGAARPDGEGGALDLLRARRQPGSTLKPFVYALFFERGNGPATVVDDLRAPMTGHAGALYSAENYDGTERGPVSARVALASSLNLAALDVARRLGQDRLVGGLASLGLAADRDAAELGAAAVLGGADVAPLELAEAYAALARGGERVPLLLTPLAGRPLEPRRVLSREAALLVRDVLSDRAARRSGFGADLAELAGRADVALKTGTSQGWRDAWAAVFDDDFTVVVWLGDPSGDPMERVSGFEAAAPAAMHILGAARMRRDELVSADAVAPPTGPANGEGATQGRDVIVHAHVCSQTGLRPGPRCTHVVDEVFARGHVPSRTCDQHAEDGALLLGERYASWVEANAPLGARLRGATASAGELAPRVTHPAEGAVLVAPPGAHPRIPLRAAIGALARSDARFEIDGVALEEAAWALAPGAHTVVAIVAGRRSGPSRFEVRTR
jgi:penicillin-binding protein 1C